MILPIATLVRQCHEVVRDNRLRVSYARNGAGEKAPLSFVGAYVVAKPVEEKETAVEEDIWARRLPVRVSVSIHEHDKGFFSVPVRRRGNFVQGLQAPQLNGDDKKWFMAPCVGVALGEGVRDGVDFGRQQLRHSFRQGAVAVFPPRTLLIVEETELKLLRDIIRGRETQEMLRRQREAEWAAYREEDARRKEVKRRRLNPTVISVPKAPEVIDLTVEE